MSCSLNASFSSCRSEIVSCALCNDKAAEEEEVEEEELLLLLLV